MQDMQLPRQEPRITWCKNAKVRECRTARFGSVKLAHAFLAMTRITITLDEDKHRSLKLLSILENKTLAQLLQEAIHAHLQAKGADRLEVTQGRSDQQPD